MYVRKKKNKSGVISIQVIDKSTGKYKVKQTIGSSSDPSEVEKLYQQGLQWIKNYTGQFELDFNNEKDFYRNFISDIKHINIIGTEILLGKIFDQIGFNKINDKLFKYLVLSRLCFPVSKLKTTDYLLKYHSIELDEDAIYRYLDKLYLLNGTKESLAENTLTDKDLLNQFKVVEQMNEEDKNIVKKVVDALITKTQIKQLAL